MQVAVLGRQMYPYNSQFLTSSYENVTVNKAFLYLCIDPNQETPEDVQVRSNILSHEKLRYTHVQRR